MAKSAYAELYAAKKGQKKAHKKAERWKQVGDIASEGIGYAAGQAETSSTAWDEYEAGYQEVTGEVSTEERGGMFSKPKGDVRIGAQIHTRESLADIGRFKQTLGESPEGLYNYDKIMSRYKEMNLSGRDMTPQEVEKYRPQKPRIEREKYDVDEEFDYDAWTAESPVYQPGQEPGLARVGKDWQAPPKREAGDGRGLNQPVQKLDAVSAAFTTPKPILSSSGVDAVSASFTPKVTVGESYGPPNPSKGTSTRSC